VFSDDSPPTIFADDSTTEANPVSSFLHRAVQQRYGKKLMDLPDQGKVARCLVSDDYGNSSTWQNSGLNIRFKDWRFIHKPFIHCLPTNAVKARWSNTAPTCRHCPEAETLPHILNHCRPDLVHIRQRHNKLVTRITNAVGFGNVTTDRAIVDDKKVLIINVTCPFDNGPDALEEAATEKVNKYLPLKEHFTNLKKQCKIYPFIIGSLGSWYPQNELLLRHLGMTKRYKSLFRKLCCTDAIQGLCDVFRLHMGWDQAV
jgi:hypothetical protein